MQTERPCSTMDNGVVPSPVATTTTIDTVQTNINQFNTNKIVCCVQTLTTTTTTEPTSENSVSFNSSQTDLFDSNCSISSTKSSSGEDIDLLDIESYSILNQFARQQFNSPITHVSHIAEGINRYWYAVIEREKIRMKANIPVNTNGYEHYINKVSVSEYICLIQQFIESIDVVDNGDGCGSTDELYQKSIKRRLARFLSSLCTKFPTLILTILYQHAEMTLNNLFFPVNILHDIFYYHIDSPVCNEEIVNIVEKLYPNCNIVPLFVLIGNVQEYLHDKLNQLYGGNEKKFTTNQLRLRIYGLPNERMFSEMFDTWLSVIFTIERQRKHANNDLQSKLILFCYYATIYEFTSTPARGDPYGAFHKPIPAELIHFASYSVTSMFFVEQLYRLAIHFCVFASIFDDNHSLYQLLSIKVGGEFLSFFKKNF